MVMEDIKPVVSKLRPIKCEMNFISKSDGSAILSQGDTVALVSVNGPLDINMKSQNIEKSTLEVLFSCKGGKPSVADRCLDENRRKICPAIIIPWTCVFSLVLLALLSKVAALFLIQQFLKIKQVHC